MENILHYVQTLNMNDLTAFLSFLGIGAPISAFLQTLRHKLDLFAGNHKKWIALILSVLSFCTAAAYYLISHSTKSPSVLIPYTTEIMAAATFWYHLAISPIYTKKIVPFLTDLTMIKQVSAPLKTTPTAVPTEFPQ